MRDFADDLAPLRKRPEEAKTYLDLTGLQARLSALEADVGRPDLWDDPDAARAATTAYGRVGGDIELLTGLEARLADTETLYQLAVEEGDESVEAELVQAVADLGRQLDTLELRSLFSGDHDDRDAVAEIHAGAGGTDAQDWAEMKLRMYLRWAARRGV